ncbi:MAG: hypothetical protein HOQ34_04965, partial [Gemmatimonadaceae bacterium]|nr:hypothetical protein [Gemmatimonadaceae bacterium]
MNIVSSIRSTSSRALVALTAVILAGAPAGLSAQDSTGTGPTVVLTLGEAVRLAARQAPTAEAGRYRAAEARARVTQARSALLPDLSADATRNGRTFNTATFGIPFPGFNPYGQVLGPVILTDLRARGR